MKRLKKDNRGFSLVELLIAIAIMAIVLAPLFHNFIVSTKLNGKAKLAMNATNMASNIMEGFNAYTAEQLVIGFDSADSRGNMAIFPDDITCESHGEAVLNPDGSWTLGYTVTGDAASGGTAGYVSGSGVSANSLTMVPSADSKYYFFARNVKQNKTYYDMLVRLDASSASTFSGDLNENGVIESGERELYNDYEAVTITTINGLVDSVYKDNSTVWSDAYAMYEPYKQQWRNCTEEEFEKETKRKIVVDIGCTKDAGGNITSTEVKVHNEYECNVNPYYPPYSITDLSTPDNIIYYSDNHFPRDIYIYYYPNYNSKNSGTNALDQIEINNTLERDVTVHLLRLPVDGDTDIATHEAAYRTNIRLNEHNADGSIHTKIYSNLKDDLSKTDAENAANRQSMDRCGFVLNGAVLDVSNAQYRAIVTENGGISTEVSDRLYSVVVEVYKEGAADLGFPQDMRIAVYDGSTKK